MTQRADRLRRAGAKPGNTNSVVSGLQSERLRPMARLAGPDGQALIAATVRHALREALAQAPDDMSRAARDARKQAREEALERVASALRAVLRNGAPHGVPAQDERERDVPPGIGAEDAALILRAMRGSAPASPAPSRGEGGSLDFETVVEGLRPLWSEEHQGAYEALVRRLRARRAGRSKRGANLRGDHSPRPWTGPRAGNSNAMRSGRYSQRLAALMAALGPRSRAVLTSAIERSMEYAIADTTFRHLRVKSRVQRWARDYGRDYGWRIVLNVLKDAGWLPPGALEAADGRPAGRRKRRELDVLAAEQLRAILKPVFDGAVRPFPERAPGAGDPRCESGSPSGTVYQ